MASDSFLLEFNTYEAYLDSFVTRKDLYYLGSLKLARKLAEQGLRSTSKTLSHEQFESRRAAAHNSLYPSSQNHHILFSHGAHQFTDTFMAELAVRERSNRVGILSTIIFLRHTSKSGFEVSGYIDFAHSLSQTCSGGAEGVRDWTAIFQGKKRLWPTMSDLGYFHWRSNVSICKSNENYKVVTDPFKGLIFINKHDRKIICPNPKLSVPGKNTTRMVIESKKYNHVILYDHVM